MTVTNAGEPSCQASHVREANVGLPRSFPAVVTRHDSQFTVPPISAPTENSSVRSGPAPPSNLLS